MEPVCHSKNAPSVPSDTSFLEKRANFDSRNSTKFDVVARFRDTIPTVTSVSSFEI